MLVGGFPPLLLLNKRPPLLLLNKREKLMAWTNNLLILVIGSPQAVFNWVIFVFLVRQIKCFQTVCTKYWHILNLGFNCAWSAQTFFSLLNNIIMSK